MSRLLLAVSVLGFIGFGPASAQEKSPLEAELQRKDKEIKALQELIQKRDQQILQLMQERDKFRNEAIAHQITVKMLQARTEALLAQVQELTVRLARKGVGLSEPKDRPKGVNPPPSFVKGKITKVDHPKEGQVEISLGSDHGLKKDHTLEAFRLQPRPEYLGTVRIIAVETQTSIGQVVSPGKQKPLKVGDAVASSIAVEQ